MIPEKPTIEEALKLYAEFKKIEKTVSEDLEVLKPIIRQHLMDEGVDKLPTNLGTFSISERTTYQYSKAVEELQKKEKANGTAKALKSVVLLFKAEEDETISKEN